MRNLKKKTNKPGRKHTAKMSRECLCDTSSHLTDRKNKEEDSEFVQCNRIFLNFAQKLQNPAKDYYNIAKVKDLFDYLSTREDLQEMKVSGWLEEETAEEKAEEEEEEELEEEEMGDGLECFDDRSTPKGGGQRFVMSRDFWYRKLNILKAQKLDEAALEAKDMPPDDNGKEQKFMRFIKADKVLSSREKKDEVYEEINLFNKSVAKPVEKELKKRFVNVYDNRKHFKQECN